MINQCISVDCSDCQLL